MVKAHGSGRRYAVTAALPAGLQAFSAGTYFTPLQYNERQIIIMHCLHRIVINSSKVLVLFVSKGLAALKGLVKFLGSEASRAPEPPGAP